MTELRHRTAPSSATAPPSPGRHFSSSDDQPKSSSAATSTTIHHRRSTIAAAIRRHRRHYMTVHRRGKGFTKPLIIIASAFVATLFLLQFVASQSIRTSIPFADLLSFLTFGIKDEAPFVVVDPTGLVVLQSASSLYYNSQQTNIVGTLPFGAIVVLTDLERMRSSRRRSVGETMRITFPYEGYIVNGRGGSGASGAIATVAPLVGDISEAQTTSSTSGSSTLKCCKRDATRNYGSNLTWDEYRLGQYSAADYRDQEKVQDEPILSNAPPWTIQYQPAGGGGNDGQIPSASWSAPTWLDQVPIGTGKTGALVGSTASASVIPISTAGLFVPPAPKGRKRRTAPHDESDNGKIFYAAREALLRGDHQTADRLIGQIHAQSAQENPMASFEYSADLVFAFSSDAVQADRTDRTAVFLQARRRGGKKQRARAGADGRGRRGGGSARDILVEDLVNSIMPRLNNQTNHNMASSPPAVAPLGQILARGQLDIRRGIYGESFISTVPSVHTTNTTSNSRQGEEGQLQLHHREYFASLGEHVIAARLQCRDLPSASTINGGGTKHRQQRKSDCLNFAASLQRTNSAGGSISSTAWSTPLFSEVSEEPSENARTEDELAVLKRQLITAGASHWRPNVINSARSLFGVTITANPTVAKAPNVEVCGVLICHGDGGKDIDDGIVVENCTDGKIVCSSASFAEVFLAIEIQSRGQDLASTSIDKRDRLRSANELKVDCHRRLLDALEVGYGAMRERHSAKFSEVMAGMDIQFAEKKKRDNDRADTSGETCDGHVLSDLLRSNTPVCTAGGSSNKEAEMENLNDLSPSLLRQQFHLSRYLLLSAAASSVPNLQFWADGPHSAWSGDYHLNVNLQMMYWGTGPAYLASTHRPLFPFLRSLSQVGRSAAQRIYNCSAAGNSWVAHGNTDHSLDGNLRAESLWVFCGTCGLWAALQLFENLLFSPLNVARTAEILHTLEILRGAVQFLQEYSFVDPTSGVRHTGPNTSPENSYVVFRNSSSISKTEYVRVSSANETILASLRTQHSGNETTPASLWTQHFVNKTVPASSWTQHLALTPAFDASLIRQLANAFPLLTRWACGILDPSDYPDATREKDKVMAIGIVALSQELPYGGKVVTGSNGVVLEYPTPLASCGRHAQLPSQPSSLIEKGVGNKKACYIDNDNRTGPLLVEESPDPGHRHFSSMHWLYPNTFIPLSNGDELIDAALKTLDLKRNAGGGHTGWSAGWMAALRARVRDGPGAWAAISRLIKHYTARNGLKLHPPLVGLPKSAYSLGKFAATPPNKNCGTCFHERDMSARGSTFGASPNRGLETARSDKFQLDGHGGLVAAFSELLVMSHIPGTVFVLPGFTSLPLVTDGGVVRGLRARGDISISAVWSGAGHALSVIGLELGFASRHFWLYGSRWKESGGYYMHHETNQRAEDGPALLRFYIPIGGIKSTGTRPIQIETSTCAQQLDEDTFASSLKKEPLVIPSQLTFDTVAVYLSIKSFPCRIRLCSPHIYERHGEGGCRMMMNERGGW